MAQQTRIFFLVLIVCISGCNDIRNEKLGDNNYARFDQESRSLRVQPDSLHVRRILSGADDVIGKPLFRVTDKSKTGILSDPRLYVSLATYWWPDPDLEEGLPYIRRDGEVNPEIGGEQSDLPRMIGMAQRVELLADAYKLSDDEKYAKPAIEQLYAWFIDKETAMYPHLEHAQMIRGLNQGRSYGVIDTWWLIQVVESFPNLKRSMYWNIEVEAGLRAWFTHYLNWLRNSEFGQKEMQSKNNHGTWYDLQVVTFARFVDQVDFAQDYLEKVSLTRISTQISISGRQRYEVRRQRPLHYSIYNLSGLMKLALHGQALEVNFKEADGWFSGGLKDAFHYLANKMEGTNPAHLVHSEDPTDTGKLYNKLTENTQMLFGTE